MPYPAAVRKASGVCTIVNSDDAYNVIFRPGTSEYGGVKC